MKSFRIVSTCLAFAATAFASQAVGAETQPQTVIELFTSQGCSSCPPADALLQELAKDPNVIAMSLPVTYWDYLGWKDTLARPENTARQNAYATIQGAGEVYTPQAVVNGVRGCVGSDKSAVRSAIDTAKASLRKSAVAVSARREGDKLIVEAGSAPSGSIVKKGKVWVASLIPHADVPIRRGENSGRKVTYTNVLRSLTEVGVWDGAATAYKVPVAARGEDQLVVYLQGDKTGPIVGAAKVGG